MLTLIIKGMELFNEEDGTFSTVGDVVIEFEHSLVSLSKWESIHQVPFLSSAEKTPDQIVDYIKCMILTPNVDETCLYNMSQEDLDQIKNYIDSPQPATTFGQLPPQRGKGETITSELIYYWMVAYQIPFSCETWHLNRLFSLIRIANIKNSPPRKMSRQEIAQRNRELNAQRRAQLGTSG
jgi:hypothetical protein